MLPVCVCMARMVCEHACVCAEVSGGHQVAFPMTLYLNPLRLLALTEPYLC